MSSAESAVTVLLAAPCAARDALREALQNATPALVEVDPLTADADAVLRHAPANVVVLLDGDTEDALDRFDSVLADPSIRLLFEEASVVTSRQGWDTARWSRHLSAKLVGSENVLPEGVGDDQGFVAPKPRDAVRTRAAGAADDATADDAEPHRAVDQDSAPRTDISPVFETDTIETVVAETMATETPAKESVDGAWQMFQAYDVDDAWQPTTAPLDTPPDLDALLASQHADVQKVVDLSTFVDADDNTTLDVPRQPYNIQTGESPAVLQIAADSDESAMAVDLPTPDPTLRATDVTRALDAPASPREWSLVDEEDTPVQPADAVVHDTTPYFEAPAARFSKLSLLDDGTDGLEGSTAVDAASPANQSEAARLGAVFLIGGAGGPDPLRTVLGALEADFPRPVMIAQHLDAGNYDRLARQMERASNLKVELATPGMVVQAGTAYVLSPGLSVHRTSDGFAFIEDGAKRGFSDFSEQLPGADSAMVFLSGADVEWADAAQRFAARGAWLAAQAEIGCFDFAVPSIMISRGADALDALSIAQKLNARWRKGE